MACPCCCSRPHRRGCPDTNNFDAGGEIPVPDFPPDTRSDRQKWEDELQRQRKVSDEADAALLIARREYESLRSRAATAARGRSQSTPGQAYAFTLTQAFEKDKVTPKDGFTKEDMDAAVRHLFRIGLTNAPSERAVSFCYVMEHKDTNFHIHGYYRTESGRRIAAQFFKRAWTIWDESIPLALGHRGGYHKKAGDISAYLEYCRKEALEVTVLA